MYLLIFLVIAFVVGYWLSRSKYNKTIDKAAQQPANWWNQLFHRSESSRTSEKQSTPVDEQEE